MECKADEDRMALSNGEGTCVDGGCASLPARLNSESSLVSLPRASFHRTPVCLPPSLLPILFLPSTPCSMFYLLLDCTAHVRTSQTCHPICSLTWESTSQQTHEMDRARVLADPMWMLRVKEQMKRAGPTRR